MQTSVIYCRVSSLGNRQNNERQISDLKQYAERLNLDVVEVFEEKISGAKTLKERQGLSHCFEYCRRNNVKTILVSELSRLGRNADDVLGNVRMAKEEGIDIIFQKEGLSIFREDGTVNPFLNVMIAVLATCAELERESIKFRLNSGRAKYIANGGKVGRPKGSTKKETVIKEEYKDAIALLKKGYSIRNVASLTGRGISTIQRVKKSFIAPS